MDSKAFNVHYWSCMLLYSAEIGCKMRGSFGDCNSIRVNTSDVAATDSTALAATKKISPQRHEDSFTQERGGSSRLRVFVVKW